MRLVRPNDTPRNRATRVACCADDCARAADLLPAYQPGALPRGFAIATRMFPLPDGYADLDAPFGTFYCLACGDALRVAAVPLPVTRADEER